MSPETSWPTAIRLKPDRSVLEIEFESGEKFVLEAEYLRVESPSAEVQGHGAVKPPPVGGKRHIHIARLEAVGNYAVRIIFDDGHSTGLYSWTLLCQLGREQSQRWAAYLARLAEAGLSREG